MGLENRDSTVFLALQISWVLILGENLELQ